MNEFKLATNEIKKDNFKPVVGPKFISGLKPTKITSFKEANEILKKFKSIRMVLKEASPAEKNIYKNAGLTIEKVGPREALQRSDINFNLKDDFGKTNLERMKLGKAPILEGRPVELHHIGQHMDSPLAELKMEEHRGKGNDTILHDKLKVSEIDRPAFQKEKEEYWKARANQLTTVA